MKVSVRDKLLLAVILLFIGALPLFPAYLGGRKLENPGDVSMSSAGWVITKDVAPGDKVAVLVNSSAGRRSSMHEIRARIFPGAELKDIRFTLGSVWKSLEGADSVLLMLDVPRDLPLGPARIVVDLDETVVRETGRLLNTVYVASSDRANRLQLPLVLRSAAECDARRTRARIEAAVAWLVACLAMYALTRWTFRRVRIELFLPGVGLGRAGGLVVLFLLSVATALAVVGHIAFVAPIVGTIVPLPSELTLAMGVVWVIGILLGLWAGFLARKPLPRWLPGKLRAVVGRPKEGTYRTAASTLPATLSREAPRCTGEQLATVLRELGLEVDARQRKLTVSVDGEQVLRFQASRPEPWLPEDLAICVREDIDAAPIVTELVKLFGPLEYKAPTGKPTMVEISH